MPLRISHWMPSLVLIMNNREIDLILESLPSTSPYYRGCVAVDQLSSPLLRNNLYSTETYNIIVCNDQVSTTSLGHWLLLFFYPDSTGSIVCSFFDSFGRDILSFDHRIFDFAVSIASDIHSNRYKLQSDKSCVCGLWCIFLSIFLTQGYSMSDILSWFSKTDRKLNDISILSYLKKLVKLPSTEKLLYCKSLSHLTTTGAPAGFFKECKSCALAGSRKRQAWMPLYPH